MQEYVECILKRYVVATLDSPTTYLVCKNQKNSFTENIINSTKTVSKKVAECLKEAFYLETGRRDIQLVILPLRISYALVQEELPVVEGDINALS